MAEDPTANRLKTAFDLFTAGVRMMRQNLKRRHPDADAEQIEVLLRQWLRERPGAEAGDGVGRQVPWPRQAH